MSPLGFLRRQSLRVRITMAFVATAVVLTAGLSTATFYVARSILEDQRVTSSTRQTVFGLLFAREFLRTDPDRVRQLVSHLRARKGFDAMVTAGGDWFSTALSLTPRAIPPELKAVVLEERLAYQVTRIDGSRALAYGAPLPPAGTDLYLFYPLDDLDRTMSLLARVLAVGSLAVVAVAALLAQLVSRRILHPLAAVSTASQRVAEGLLETRLETSSRDELGLLAESFNRMAAALQGMIDRERRFAAGVSHELRTPLAALHATSELLAAHREELSPAAREAVDLIVEDVRDLRRLVEELMEVSELDAGAGAVRWEEVDLRALATAVVRKRHREARVEGSEAKTHTDKARVERILGNLVDNAYQHGEGRDVRVVVWAEDATCAVAVSDRGPGIRPEDLPFIFDRFYKADRSRTRERGGIGLGLAIASANARLLQATIDVTSSPGQGSTFTLRLPRRSAPPPEHG